MKNLLLSSLLFQGCSIAAPFGIFRPSIYTEDEDSINIDTNGDKNADIIIPK